MKLEDISIDKRVPRPVYAQLAEQIRLLVHSGVLKPGAAMPTVRTLAVDLGINANTVARVYRDLQRENLLRLERGLGTFVADGVGADVDAGVFADVEAKGRALVKLARVAGLRRGELIQLIDSLWKERSDVHR